MLAVLAVTVGAAGVGETALAAHWAHAVADRLADGVPYLDVRCGDATARVDEAVEALRRSSMRWEVPLNQIRLT